MTYDAGLLNHRIYSVAGDFPHISMKRGGISFDPPTPSERRASEAMHSLISRIVTRQQQARHAAIDAAIIVAVREGWDVHVHEPPERSYSWRRTDDDLRSGFFIGIEFKPAGYGVPTVHFHQSHDDMWDWDDD